MNRLINELKNDHKSLSKLLEEVQNPRITSPKAKKILIEAKETLLIHLKKEDAELYSVLQKLAETNVDIKRTLQSFAKDMNEITTFVFNFFDRIENNNYHFIEYSKDFGKLVNVLSSRFRREEFYLYPFYKEITG